MSEKKRFATAFDKVDEKLDNGKSKIDFKNSSVNKKTDTKKEKTGHRTNRIQTYLSDSEFNKFVETLNPLEKPAERARAVILEDIRKRLELRKLKDSKS